MHHFETRNGVLHAEDVDLQLLAEKVGTPFYCYSEATIRRHIHVFQKAFADLRPLIAYSVKANSNLSILAIMREEGVGADVVSGGELARALEAGIPPDRIVFSGVGKKREEMAAALDAGIFQFNVESEPELAALNEVALSTGVRAPIAFRINPDVSAGGHEKISTGKAEDKFGVPWSRARELYRKAAALPGISITGVDVHIGSQISDLAPFERAFERVAALVRELRSDGHAIKRLDLGGGLGIPYGDPNASQGNPPHPDDYARLIRRIAAPLDIELIFEPGRMIVGNAGILVSRVIYVKEGETNRFLIVDAAMNDLIRPALYDAYHAIEPVRPRAGDRRAYDIVGPVCETGDRFARARVMPPLLSGDLVAFMSAGAYGAVQASQYNSRPLVPELLVSGGRYAIIRRRPDYDALVAAERAPEWNSL
jgi:diaminopimelate decarboxylase